ncbi:DUF1254 domain-containing protein [Maricaulis sp.]|uniref:DUF1254 domain-containing protein n=1 Tax=Maricaulis sp. TaxID=1486257 RepID=UPI003A95DA88
MRWLVPLAAGLLAGALGFWVSLDRVPGFIMSRTMERILDGGAPLNGVTHVPPVTETSRGVVRPSPDILYSVCPFDLSDGPLLIQAQWPQSGSYASISLYDAHTNNIFTLSDRDQGRAAAIWLDQAGTTTAPAGAIPVESPSETGLVLYRRIVEDPSGLEVADAGRRSFMCETQQR